MRTKRTTTAHGDPEVSGAESVRTDDAVQELRIVGGAITVEGRELAAAACAAGLNVRWLDFASIEAQTAIVAQGPGSVRLPVVIVGGRYTLQRPPLSAVSACVTALRAGEHTLPADAIALGTDLAA